MKTFKMYSDEEMQEYERNMHEPIIEEPIEITDEEYIDNDWFIGYVMSTGLILMVMHRVFVYGGI